MYRNLFKRVFDFIFAVLFFVVFSPILIITYFIIKKDSEGPALFIQERTGKNGKPFKMYKFRTMIVETEKNGRTLTHDERVTKVGSFLRKTSIDELPQIINIIKGDMSFIGPRPWITEYYEKFDEEQKKRVDVLPGISGQAQTMGRNGISIFDKINHDIEYSKNVSLWLDLKILFLTFIVLLKREHAEISQENIVQEIELLNK